MTNQQKRILLSLAFLGISLFAWHSEDPKGFKSTMHQIAVILALTCEAECHRPENTFKLTEQP